MSPLVRDLRHALRLLRKEPVFGATILVTLAVCIGANVAIYSVVHAVLLEPLPFPAPDRLVSVYNSYPRAGAQRGSNGTVDFFQRRENVPAFAEVALHQGGGSTVGEAGGPERVAVARVTPSLFPLLGVEAMRGRTFTEDEMVEGNHRKVVLGHGYWQERFGGDEGIVGREIRIDGVMHAVVGILDEGFEIPGRGPVRLYVPLAFDEEDRDLQSWHSNSFQLIARLAPGATLEQARAQNDALNDRLIDVFPLPNARQLLEDAGYETVLLPLADDVVEGIAPVLYMLWAGVGFVLLIGCVNVANLMLARARGRLGETATRLALGASRARVARRTVTEAVLLAVLGGVLGAGLGALGLRLLVRLGVDELPRGTTVAVDGPVLAFTLVVAVAAGALFGLVPALQALRRDLSPVFRTDSRTGTASRRAVLLRNGLVTVQVALAFVLLAGAALMMQSFRAALSVEPGFEPEGVLTAFVSLPSARYPDADARRRFWDELLAEARALPGVERAGLTTQMPFTGSNSNSIVFPEGYVPSPGESILSPAQSVVSPDFFETLQIELLEGRLFAESDGPDAAPVMVIDDWLADRYWPDGGAVGDRMVFGAAPGADSVPPDAVATVVGVVRRIKLNDLTAPDAEHVGAYWFTHRVRVPGSAVLAVRARDGEPAGLTPALREVLGRLDPELPLYGVESLQARIDDSLARRRVPLILLAVFAGIALFLAVVGLYGALAYSVSQRRREIGIRLAVGSSPGEVFRVVVGEGLRLTALGLVAGGATAWFATRLIESLLFGVEPADPGLAAAVAGVLGAVALLACLLPARRATRVDPVEALTA